jgi:hypothetical protein
VGKNVFEKEIRYSFLMCIFEKEASKKEKIAKVLKPQKLNKTKNIKNIGSEITNQRRFIFIFR